MDILLRCKIVDQSGHGVPTIVDIYGEEVYTFSENFISVTIPFYKAINSHDKNKVENDGINDGINLVTSENDGIKLKNNEILVLHYIEINPKATILELSDNLSKSIKTVERIVLILKEKGFIKRVGSKKNGYWKIMK